MADNFFQQLVALRQMVSDRNWIFFDDTNDQNITPPSSSLDNTRASSTSISSTDSYYLNKRSFEKYCCILKSKNHLITCLLILNNLILSGSKNGDINIWLMNNSQAIDPIPKAHNGRIYSLVASSNKDYFYSTGSDGFIKKWFMKSELIHLPKQKLIFQLKPEVIFNFKPNRVDDKKFIVAIASPTSFDNEIIISAGSDKIIKLWNQNCENYFKFTGHEEAINCLTVANTNDFFVSGSDDFTIKVWEFKSNKDFESNEEFKSNEALFTLIGHKAAISAVAITNNNKFIISGSDDNTIRIWNYITNDCHAIFEGHQDWVTGVAISANDEYIFSSSKDNTIKIWNISTTECAFTLQDHENKVSCLAVTGQHIVSGSYDETLRIWSMPTRECLFTLENHKDHVNCVIIAKNQDFVISCGDDHHIMLWNPTTNKFIRSLTGHDQKVTCLTIWNDYLISGSSDNTIKIWNINSSCSCSCSFSCCCCCTQTLEGHKGTIHSLSISDDGTRLYSGSEDKTIKIWYSKFINGNTLLIKSINTESVVTCTTLMNGRFLLGGCSDGIIRAWLINDLKSESESKVDSKIEFLLNGHQGSVTSLSLVIIDNIQCLLSSSKDKTIKIWNLTSHECIATLHGHLKQVNCVTTTRNDGYVYAISGSDDQTVRVWNLTTHECIHTFHGHQDSVSSVVMTGNDEHILSGSYDRTLKVFPFSFKRHETIAFKTLEWLIDLFRSHQGSVRNFEAMLGLCPSFLDDIFVSDDGKRTTTFLARAIELNAPDHMLEELFKLKKTNYAWNNLFHSSNYDSKNDIKNGTNDTNDINDTNDSNNSNDTNDINDTIENNNASDKIDGKNGKNKGKKSQNILEYLMEKNRERALQFVLDNINYGFDQHNQVRMGHLTLSQASWRVTPEITSSPDFTKFI